MSNLAKFKYSDQIQLNLTSKLSKFDQLGQTFGHFGGNF